MYTQDAGNVGLVPGGTHSSGQEWNRNVYVESNGTLYLSKKHVPIGIPITDTAYWMKGPERGKEGVGIVSASFDGNDILFLRSDNSTVRMVGAKLTFKGEKGDKGDKGTTGAIYDRFETLEALEAAYPTGDEHNFLVGNHLYYYNGGWQDGGEFTDNAQVQALRAEVAANENLFNQAMSVLDPGAEVGAARISTVKAKTFDLLGSRIEELENDINFPATNRVTNGDFSDGVTGWSGNGANIAAANNTVSVTGTGSLRNPCIYRGAPATVIGNKYYVRFKFKVLNSACQDVRAKHGAATTIFASAPVQDRVYDTSAVIIADMVEPYLYMYFYYADAAAALDKAAEIQYVLIFDLTAVFGAGNEPTAAVMDALLSMYPNSWFNGAVNLALAPKAFPLMVGNRQHLVEKTSYGVFSGLGVTAQGSPNMTVNVAAGVCFTPDGRRVTPAANAALAINAADATNPRLDIVYVDAAGVIRYLAGTPAATPAAPALPAGCVPLAEISVAAAAASIVTANIKYNPRYLYAGPWYPVTLSNGATQFDATSSPVGYCKDASGRVQLRGLVNGYSTSGIILMLPAGFRPSKTIYFVVRDGGNAMRGGYITTSGGVYMYTPFTTYISLDQLSFLAI